MRNLKMIEIHYYIQYLLSSQKKRKKDTHFLIEVHTITYEEIFSKFPHKLIQVSRYISKFLGNTRKREAC